VSPIISSTKLSHVQKSYNSVNMSAEGGMAGAQGNCDTGNNGGSGSGSSTPNHLSQQNLIKIMKKIKSSASNV
jgi:hypothetical protein